MRIPYSWLKEFVDIEKSPGELAEDLSMAGFEVEGIDDLSEMIRGVEVGYIAKVEKHPNADKLNICNVLFGDGNSKQIVCGAPNVKEDIHVFVAKIGSYLKNIDLKIKKSNIRGIESNGMICSLSELGIEDESDGIAIIEEMEVNEYEIGTSATEIFNLEDSIFDIAITANRPDGMSIKGIAREVSAITESNLKFKDIKKIDKNDQSSFKRIDDQIIKKEDSFILAFINGIDNKKKTPEIIKKRIEMCGINSINLVVDITNYVMLETGQPLHVYDKDKLNILTNKEINHSNYSVELTSNKENFKGIDNKDYLLKVNTPVIKCDNNIIAIAGIIGSENSCVGTNSRNIVLEAGLFSQKIIRNASRNNGIRTEASSRFEKGIPSSLTSSAIDRFIEILNENQLINIKEIYTSCKENNFNRIVKLRRSFIDKILGPKVNNLVTTKESNSDYIEDNEIEEKLKLLDCKCQRSGEDWMISIPPHRSHDLEREIDLIEEIARLIGYDNFQANLPQPIRPGALNIKQSKERELRRSLVNSGIQEITTISLVHEKENNINQIKLKNPLFTDTSCLRDSLWENHLEISKTNLSSGKLGCWIFEIGSIYEKQNNKIKEKRQLAGVISGERRNEKWTTSGKIKNLNYFEARGVLERSFKLINISFNFLELKDNKYLHPGRSSSIQLEGQIIGVFGQIHPKIYSEQNLHKETYIFEIDIDKVLTAASRKNNTNPLFKQFPLVPTIERDLSIKSKNYIPSLDICSLIRKTGKPLLENVEIIDRYEGKSEIDEFISQTFRITYRDKNKTLEEKDIIEVHQKIRNIVCEKFKCELRS